MQTHNRQALLSSALSTGPASPAGVTRDTVEAAIWQTLGWDVPEAAVSRILMVVDAYTDSRVRRAITRWVQEGRGDQIPPPEPLGTAAMARHCLNLIRSSPPITAPVAPVPRPRPAAPAGSLRLLQPRELEPFDPAKAAAEEPASAAREAGENGSFPASWIQPARPAFEPAAEPEPEAEAGMTEPAEGLQAEAEAESSTAAIGTLFTCGKCKKRKSREFFHANRSRPSGVAHNCKKCASEENRLYRERKAEKAKMAAEAAEKAAS